MALTDKVTARYSAQRLVEVTNPGVPAALAIDAARLAAAAADATGDFLRIVGIAYDDANAVHIGPAVRRTYARLLEYMDPAGEFAKNMIADTREELSALRGQVGVGVRLTPVTDSVLTPSRPDTSSGDTVRPDFDAERFSDYLIDGTPRDPNS